MANFSEISSQHKIDELISILIRLNSSSIIEQNSTKLAKNQRSNVVSLQMAIYKFYADVLMMTNVEFNPIQQLKHSLAKHMASTSIDIYVSAFEYHQITPHQKSKSELYELFKLTPEDSQFDRILSNPIKTVQEFVYLYKHHSPIRQKNPMSFIANVFAILSNPFLNGRIIVQEDHYKFFNIGYGNTSNIFTPEYFTGWRGVSTENRESILQTVFETNPITSSVFNVYDEFVMSYNNHTKKLKRDLDVKIFGTTFSNWKKLNENAGFTEKFAETHQLNKLLISNFITGEYIPYSPIHEKSLIHLIDSTFHPSYIELLLNVCNDIISHSDVECESNVMFATNVLNSI